uniref:Iron hydrogenase large subunit C-terminal domain-containing protein n=1 Tax=Balaenoptera musculus TaxID=9771 RepID=A0A8C0E2H6_BALMU
MKCEHCTRKECSKKTKTDDQENASVDVPSPAHENGEKGEFHKLADAKIFLSDCLACDSCVSAEEGVQVSQQNAKDFFRVLNLNKKCDTSKHKVLAVSVCPQSLPYFAAKFSLSVTDASRRLCGFLKSLGVQYVFDTTIAADFSILESQKEFVRRFRQHNEEEPTLPMLTSACPGWVRYAERVLGHPVTPHLCTAKSPQQIMGSLVKDYLPDGQVSRPFLKGSMQVRRRASMCGQVLMGTEGSEGGRGGSTRHARWSQPQTLLNEGASRHLVTQLPASGIATNSCSVGGTERGGLVSWEASGKSAGKMAGCSFTAQQWLVVMMFGHHVHSSGETGQLLASPCECPGSRS